MLRATLLLHIAAISLVYGQIRSGTITGTVKDASGAVVAGASVSIGAHGHRVGTSREVGKGELARLRGLSAGVDVRFFDYGDVSQPRAFGTSGFNDAPTITKDRNPYGQIGDTIVISPSLLFDIRYGATRIIALNLGGNRTGFTDYASFGIPTSTQTLFASYGAAPIVSPNGFGGGSAEAATGAASRPVNSSINRNTSSVMR
jgi:hypothetical protein